MGLIPRQGLILWKPREGEDLCRYEDLEQILETQADEIALLMIGSTNYYSGQHFPLKKITALGHKHNCLVGFDLAHGAGNIQPNLHDSGADFAVWCTYKYLNSGPGSLGGCFVHERHQRTTNNSIALLVGGGIIKKHALICVMSLTPYRAQRAGNLAIRQFCQWRPYGPV